MVPIILPIIATMVITITSIMEAMVIMLIIQDITTNMEEEPLMEFIITGEV
jgi:hypothetical protein